MQYVPVVNECWEDIFSGEIEDTHRIFLLVARVTHSWKSGDGSWWCHRSEQGDHYNFHQKICCQLEYLQSLHPYPHLAASLPQHYLRFETKCQISGHGTRISSFPHAVGASYGTFFWFFDWIRLDGIRMRVRIGMKPKSIIYITKSDIECEGCHFVELILLHLNWLRGWRW